MTDIPNINLALFAQTDVGMVRSGNEDNFLILDLSTGGCWTALEEEPADLLTFNQGFYGTLLAVSDGMGGALAGEVASRMAVETVRDRMLQLQSDASFREIHFSERLRFAVEQANDLIHLESLTNPLHKGLGATFTAVAVNGRDVYFAQVGDSRAYLIRDGKIYRITKDQSLVQQLIDAGQITEEEAETHSYRNVILQALGAHSVINVEMNTISLRESDVLLLCSDGLSGKIHEPEIARIVIDYIDKRDFQSACRELIRLANHRGGEDNITVVIAYFTGEGLKPTTNGEVKPQSLPRSPSTPTNLDWRAEDRQETSPLNSGYQPLGTVIPEEDPRNATTAPLSPSQIPEPPTRSKPFTPSLNRENLPRASRSDQSHRRGPITAVFGISDSGEDLAITSSSSQSALTGSEPLVRSGAGQQTPKAAATIRHSSDARPVIGGDRKTSLAMTIILALLALSVIGVGGLLYLKKQAKDQVIRQQLEAQQMDEAKSGQIIRIRSRIEQIQSMINVRRSDKPSQKPILDPLDDQLNKLRIRLDGVVAIPPQEQDPIKQLCEEISRDLQKIEDDLNNLQGLLPSSLTRRDPVRI